MAKTHLCFDQKEWCADRIGDIDVRMTAWYLGLAQIHDGATKDWAYVHAPEGAREDTALAVCKALGFTALKFAKEDEKGLSAATKSVSCSAAAANAGSIKVRAARQQPRPRPRAPPRSDILISAPPCPQPARALRTAR